MIKMRQKSIQTDTDQGRKPREKCQRTIDYVFAKCLSNVNGHSVINKGQTIHKILLRKQKNQERATYAIQKTDQRDQSLKEVTVATSENHRYLRLDKEKLLTCFICVNHFGKSNFKKPTDAERLISNLSNKSLNKELRSNYNETLSKARNPKKSRTKPRTEDTKANHSKENNFQKVNCDIETIAKRTEKQNKDDVTQKLGLLTEIEKAPNTSDVQKKESVKWPSTHMPEKKIINDNGILQGIPSFPMNQFGDLHSKVTTNLNPNNIDKESVNISNEIKPSLSEETAISINLENHHKQKCAPSRLNFGCEIHKIAAEKSSKLLLHLTAKAETKTDCLNSHKYQEQKSAYLRLVIPGLKIIVNGSNKPSQTLLKIVDSKIDCLDKRAYCAGKFEPEYINPTKREPADGTTPENLNKTKYAEPKTDELVRSTKISTDRIFTDIVKVVTTRNQCSMLKGWTEPVNLVRCSSSYNVYPRQQRPSNHFKWLLQRWKQGCDDNECGPVQLSNTSGVRQTNLPTNSSLTDFKITQDMSLSEMLQLVRMRHRYPDSKKYLEYVNMTKTCTDGLPQTAPKDQCRPGRCPLARICSKCPNPPPCAVEPCESGPLKKLRDPCPNNTCPRTCDNKKTV